VRYTISAEPFLCVACHCKNCQLQAGTVLSIVIGVAETAVSFTGELKTYNDIGDSGAAVRRQFCPECGSPVFTRVDQPEGVMFVKAGTLDDTSDLKPAAHCYTKSKQDWIELGDTLGFDTLPQGL